LETQGSLPTLPVQYDNFVDCFKKIIAREGWQALYNGIDAQAFSLVPELLFVGAIYFFFSVAIEFLYDSDDKQAAIDQSTV
jgi:hypothetical protein